MRKLGIAFCALLYLTGVASADIFLHTEDDIDFTLVVNDLGATIDVSLTMDTTGYPVTIPPEFLHAVGVKVVGAVDVANVSLDAAPGGTGLWTLKNGQPNSNTIDPAGNATGGGAGWFATHFNTALGVTLPGGILTFEWTITTALDPLGPPGGGPSLKAIYVDLFGNYKGNIEIGTFADQTSSGELDPGPSSGPGPGTPIPEPGSLALLLLAVGGFVVAKRRS